MTEANTRKNLLVSLLIALWTRLPVAVQAILTGPHISGGGHDPLVSAGIDKRQTLVSHSLASRSAALYLWLFWRFVRFCREVGDIGTIAFLIVGSARVAFI